MSHSTLLSVSICPPRDSSRGIESIQWVSGVLIEAADPPGIEAILADFERSTGQRLRWKLLDSETYRVNSMVKSLIADGLGPRHPEPTGKQVRLCAVVERVHVKSPQLRPLSTRMGSISLLRKDIEQPARVERCIKNLGARRRACAEVTFDPNDGVHRDRIAISQARSHPRDATSSEWAGGWSLWQERRAVASGRPLDAVVGYALGRRPSRESFRSTRQRHAELR
jgi:hypothetical protein